ncbi:MAG: RIP metalloprotease [Hyphomonadaceae bacterium]|nr:RIP metalloprotease [Hyphomonadaceae bacterium]
MDNLISILGSAIPFIIVISIVITVHELGHYWVGRWFGAAVESFSIGFGRPIFEVKDKRGTRWRVNWLPLGGFVKFVGELQAPTDSRNQGVADPNVDITEIHGAEGEPTVKLVGKPYTELGPLKRLAVSLGGPFANFVFAVVVFAALGMAMGVAQSKEVLVNGTVAGSAAEAAGFKPGDILLQAGGRTVTSATDVQRATVLNAGEEVRYRVLRGGEQIELIAVPKSESTYNKDLKVRESIGRIGIDLGERETEIRRLNPIEAVGYGFWRTGDALDATVTVLRRLVTGKDGLDKLSGPLGIFTVADNGTDLHMKQEGVSFDKRLIGAALWLINLSALLSIGVGFFNLLPIPVLDGGAAVMCIAEAATGREVPEKVQKVGLTIGLACLVSFALVITWQDITRLPMWAGAP